MTKNAKAFLLGTGFALCAAAVLRILTSGSTPAVWVAGLATVGILVVTALPTRDAQC